MSVTVLTVQHLEMMRGSYKKWNIAVDLPAGVTLTDKTLTFKLKVGSTTITKSSPSSGITIVDPDAGTATLELLAADTSGITNENHSGYSWELWISDNLQLIARGDMKIVEAIE